MARNPKPARRALAELALEHFPDEAARVLEKAPVSEIAALLEAQPPRRTEAVLRARIESCGSRLDAVRIVEHDTGAVAGALEDMRDAGLPQMPLPRSAP